MPFQDVKLFLLEKLRNLYIYYLYDEVVCCVISETNKKKSSVQRSEEVGGGLEMRNRLIKQGSRESTDGSMGSISSIESSVYVTKCGYFNGISNSIALLISSYSCVISFELFYINS